MGVIVLQYKGANTPESKKTVEVVQLVLNSAINTIAKEANLTVEETILMAEKLVSNALSDLNELEKDHKIKALFDNA